MYLNNNEFFDFKSYSLVIEIGHTVKKKLHVSEKTQKLSTFDGIFTVINFSIIHSELTSNNNR